MFGVFTEATSVNVALIEAVKKRPCLYNTGFDTYMNKDQVDEAWEEVAAEMGKTVYLCRERWKNLRASFKRAMRPNYRRKRGTYYLWSHLQFLLPFVKAPSSDRKGSNENRSSLLRGIQDDQENSRDDGDILGENHDDFLELEVQDSLSDNAQENADATPTENLPSSRMREDSQHPENPKKRKLPNNFTMNTFNSLPSPTHFQPDLEENPRRMFLLGLLDEVEDLSDEQMILFKRKVLRLLDDVRGVSNVDLNKEEKDTANEKIDEEVIEEQIRSTKNKKSTLRDDMMTIKEEFMFIENGEKKIVSVNVINKNMITAKEKNKGGGQKRSIKYRGVEPILDVATIKREITESDEEINMA